jgi:hypothetical protein
MLRLTKIEKLDQQFPGLAADVRRWFAQGIPAKKIPPLVAEKYAVLPTKSSITRFRFLRWAPEQRRLQEKRIALLAAREVTREEAVRVAMTRDRPGEAK